MNIFLIVFIIAFSLTCFSYNISMAHTQGTATDTIDDTASNTPNVSPKITIPVSPTGI